MRFRVDPRDVKPEAAARRLGMTLVAFNAALDNLICRGFPKADPDTGNFDLHAIDRWCDSRNPHLFGGASAAPQARDARSVVADRLQAMRAGARGG